MDWNRNGKRDPADDIIDWKLSEAGKKPAEPPSARPRCHGITGYSRRKDREDFSAAHRFHSAADMLY